MRDPIEELLRGTHRDPDGGPNLAPATRSIVIRDDLDGDEAALVQGLGFGKQLAVVSDPNTHRAMGRRVERALAREFAVQSIVLPGDLHADQAALDEIDRRMRGDTSAIIAVGSGTINDLCKAVAAGSGRPYAVFGTAPSMNGYSSATASIAVAGLKSSIAARAPDGVFLDLEVLAAAPVRMIRAGLAECLCRTTAQADWLLAHLLLDEPYRSAPFALVREDEDALVAGATGLMAGDLAAMNRLARALVLSGMGMAICGSSRSSSQGEHMISHYMDMTQPAAATPSYHGEQIAVTTLFMAELQERILARDEAPSVRPTGATRDQVIEHFGPQLGELCWRELAAKELTQARADELNFRLEERWRGIRERIAAVVRPAAELRAAFERTGAPTEPGDLGWPPERFYAACVHAREIRNRYTFLDLAAEAGIALFTK